MAGFLLTSIIINNRLRLKSQKINHCIIISIYFMSQSSPILYGVIRSYQHSSQSGIILGNDKIHYLFHPNDMIQYDKNIYKNSEVAFILDPFQNRKVIYLTLKQNVATLDQWQNESPTYMSNSTQTSKHQAQEGKNEHPSWMSNPPQTSKYQTQKITEDSDLLKFSEIPRKHKYIFFIGTIISILICTILFYFDRFKELRSDAICLLFSALVMLYVFVRLKVSSKTERFLLSTSIISYIFITFIVFMISIYNDRIKNLIHLNIQDITTLPNIKTEGKLEKVLKLTGRGKGERSWLDLELHTKNNERLIIHCDFQYGRDSCKSFEFLSEQTVQLTYFKNVSNGQLILTSIKTDQLEKTKADMIKHYYNQKITLWLWIILIVIPFLYLLVSLVLLTNQNKSLTNSSR